MARQVVRLIATSSMDVRYLLCDLLTGLVLHELPLAAGDKLRHLIGRVEQTTFTLPVYDDKCPAAWADLIVGGKSMIVLVIDDTPAQGWAVVDRTIGAALVPISVATLETCLAGANIGDLDPTGLDQSQVAAYLTAPLGPRFGFGVTWTACGLVNPGDEDYQATTTRTLLDAVNALQALAGGPEWRIALGWADDTHRSVTKTLEISPKIGRDRPDAIFDLDAAGNGSIATYTRLESYAPGKGATRLVGTAGESGPDPVLVESALIAAGWPIWEYRLDIPDLDSGAAATAPGFDADAELARRTRGAAARMEHGQATWSIAGRVTGPKPGRDYDSGDTVHVAVAPRPPVDPTGGTAAVRVIGWELDLRSGQSNLVLFDDGSGTGG